MFLKAAGFKKLINNAYKGSGLHLINDGIGLYVAGGHWIAWFKEGAVPKKALGAIIELTGEIPKPGEAFNATKEGNQIEMKEINPAILEVLRNAWETELYLTDTGILIDWKFSVTRLLQLHNQEIHLVQESIFEMISGKDLENGEDYPDGPFYGKYKGIYWRNDQAVFMVCECATRENDYLIGHLERVPIKDGKVVLEDQIRENSEKENG